MTRIIGSWKRRTLTATAAMLLVGFRRATDHQFLAPLTSVQRVIAGRDGWRLHIIASGSCRASVVVGNDSRFVEVSLMRSTDHAWQVRVVGTDPALTLRRPAVEKMAMSVVVDKGGTVQAMLDGRSAESSRIDRASPPPNPPYGLAFDENPNAPGCHVVWLEIPILFPTATTAPGS